MNLYRHFRTALYGVAVLAVLVGLRIARCGMLADRWCRPAEAWMVTDYPVATAGVIVLGLGMGAWQARTWRADS